LGSARSGRDGSRDNLEEEGKVMALILLWLLGAPLTLILLLFLLGVGR
jgi:hypothetical protein